MRRRLVPLVAAVLVLAVAATGLLVWRHDRADAASGTELQGAMSHALPDARLFSWTDWAAVRARIDPTLDAGSTAAQLRRFFSRGFDADLTSRTALETSAPVMQEHYGFSPASIDWELFAQSTTAAVVMMGVPDDLDLGSVATSLRTIGYQEPAEPGGIWRGDLGEIKRVGEVTPELTFISLDATDHVILASDSETGIAAGLQAYGSTAGVVEGLGGVVAALGSPTSAAVFSSDGVCKELAMAGADPTDQAAATDLLAQAGTVDPLTGFSMGYEDDGHVTAAMGFETADQARTNATTRARLASGPALGQGGDFSDRFTLGRVEATGLTVTMDLVPKPDSYVLSDLSSGPLLFATC